MFHDFGGRVVFGLRKQDVNVIAYGIDLDQMRIVVFKNACNVRVQLVTFFIPKKLAAVLGAENQMHDDIGE